MTCSVNGCERAVKARGWCNAHWSRWKRHGDPAAGRIPNGCETAQRAPCNVENCAGNSHYTAKGRGGLCSAHYHRFMRHGDPLGGKVSHGTLLAWIAEHASFDGDECLPWPFARDQQGYGKCRYRGRMINSHRAMCFEAHGNPPDPSNDAAHSCGMGKQIACMNPKHLRWATRQENVDDMLIHGTHPSQRCRAA